MPVPAVITMPQVPPLASVPALPITNVMIAVRSAITRTAVCVVVQLVILILITVEIVTSPASVTMPR